MELVKIKAWDMMWRNVNLTWKKLMQKYLEQAMIEFKENYIYVEMYDDNDDNWKGVRVPKDKDKEYIEMLNKSVREVNMFGSATIDKIIKTMLSPVDYEAVD